jgi:hypothetical protein
VKLGAIVIYVSHALLTFVSIKPGERKKNVARKQFLCTCKRSAQ